MAHAKQEEQYYTFEEYLAMEEKAEFKSEYEKGKITAMAGGTPNHSFISQNTGTAIANELRKKDKKCRVSNSEIKIRIEEFDKGVYPDVSVICEAMSFYNNRKDIITNPLLVVEVLSNSTKDYDKGSKFTQYRSLPSFREYVLIDQYEAKVESWYKVEENIWRISNARGLDASIKLFSLDIEIKLSDIFYLIDGLEEEKSS